MAKKKRKRSAEEDSLVAAIEDRISGSGQASSLFVNIEENKKGGNKIRLLGNEYVELGQHVFTDGEGNWHFVLCRKKRLRKGPWMRPKGGCIVCKLIKLLIEKGREERADRLKRQTVFAWNAIDCANPLNDDGELAAKIFQHKWTVFTDLADLIAEFGKMTDPDTGYPVRIFKQRTKRPGTKRSQVRYKVRETDEGESVPLTEKERALELHNLIDFYKFDTAEDVKDWLGLKSKKKKARYEEEEEEPEEDEEEFKDEEDEEEE